MMLQRGNAPTALAACQPRRKERFVAATGLSKLKEQISSMKSSNARARVRRRAEAIQHTVVGGAAAFAIGRMEKSGTAMPTMFGLDPKIVVGVGLKVIGASSSGKFGDFADACGDGAIAAYGYAEGKGTAVSGVGGTGDDFEAV